jgi:hypothetical protein
LNLLLYDDILLLLKQFPSFQMISVSATSLLLFL